MMSILKHRMLVKNTDSIFGRAKNLSFASLVIHILTKFDMSNIRRFRVQQRTFSEINFDHSNYTSQNKDEIVFCFWDYINLWDLRAGKWWSETNLHSQFPRRSGASCLLKVEIPPDETWHLHDNFI